MPIHAAEQARPSERVVGVVVPCFNQSEFAVRCIDSLEAQTYRAWRAVLIDDASSDESAARLPELASTRLRVVRCERNLGRAAVRNEGLRLLGDVDYVLNVDCDDFIAPDYLEKLVNVLDADPTLGIAYGTLKYFGSPHPTGQHSWPPRPFCFDRRFLENVIPGGGAMFRRAALAQTEGWRSAFSECGSEDYDLWLQVVERAWAVRWVTDAVYWYRQHELSFLARSGMSAQVEAKLALLRFHGGSIRRSGAMAEFLRPELLPALLSALRSGEVRTGITLLAQFLRRAPLTTVRLLTNHYVRRLARRESR